MCEFFIEQRWEGVGGWGSEKNLEDASQLSNFELSTSSSNFYLSTFCTTSLSRNILWWRHQYQKKVQKKICIPLSLCFCTGWQEINFMKLGTFLNITSLFNMTFLPFLSWEKSCQHVTYTSELTTVKLSFLTNNLWPKLKWSGQNRKIIQTTQGPCFIHLQCLLQTGK